MSHIQKTVKMSLKGKTFRKWANGQNIYKFEKEIDLRVYSDPVLGPQPGAIYISQISGERLQYHWSSSKFRPELAYSSYN